MGCQGIYLVRNITDLFAYLCHIAIGCCRSLRLGNGSLGNFFYFEISKGCFVGSKEILDQVEPTLREKFSKDLYIVRADDHFLECLHPNVNKGNGLKELGEKIGITPDEMIAFGDEIGRAHV